MSEYTSYQTLQELEDAEANGYVTVAVFQKTSRKGRVRILTSVTGMYDTKRDARRAAASHRAKIRRDMRDNSWYYESAKVELLSVNVEAVWKP